MNISDTATPDKGVRFLRASRLAVRDLTSHESEVLRHPPESAECLVGGSTDWIRGPVKVLRINAGFTFHGPDQVPSFVHPVFLDLD